MAASVLLEFWEGWPAHRKNEKDMPTRSRKEEITYKNYLKQLDKSNCIFCKLHRGDKQFVDSTKSFKIIRNIFSYSLWDNQNVAEHLMVVPKKHIDSLDELSQPQAKEFINLISRYEKKGYNIYARTPGSIIKTIPHQHTHLIKNKGKKKNFLFFLRRPFYVRLSI